MGQLQIIDSGLIPIYEDDHRERVVNARELYEFLEVSTRFNDWIERRIKKYGFMAGQDFYSLLSKSTGGRPSTEYYLTIDTAKELSMVENNERGRQVRRYFIEVEKRFRKSQQGQHELPKTFSEALRLAADQAEQLEKMEAERKILLPKAESFDTFLSADNAQPVRLVAKALGTGPNKLFARLREEGILMDGHRDKRNLPYQQYIDAGYFRVKETPVVMGEKTVNVGQTLVTPKGVEWIANRLGMKRKTPVN